VLLFRRKDDFPRILFAARRNGRAHIRTVRFLNYTILVITIVGGFKPQSTVLFIQNTFFLQFIKTSLDIASFVQRSFKIKIIKMCFKFFKQCLLFCKHIVFCK